MPPFLPLFFEPPAWCLEPVNATLMDFWGFFPAMWPILLDAFFFFSAIFIYLYTMLVITPFVTVTVLLSTVVNEPVAPVGPGPVGPVAPVGPVGPVTVDAAPVGPVTLGPVGPVGPLRVV